MFKHAAKFGFRKKFASVKAGPSTFADSPGKKAKRHSRPKKRSTDLAKLGAYKSKRPIVGTGSVHMFNVTVKQGDRFIQLGKWSVECQRFDEMWQDWVRLKLSQKNHMPSGSVSFTDRKRKLVVHREL